MTAVIAVCHQREGAAVLLRITVASQSLVLEATAQLWAAVHPIKLLGRSIHSALGEMAEVAAPPLHGVAMLEWAAVLALENAAWALVVKLAMASLELMFVALVWMRVQIAQGWSMRFLIFMTMIAATVPLLSGIFQTRAVCYQWSCLFRPVERLLFMGRGLCFLSLSASMIMSGSY
jgi:hypothetical protein